MDKNPQINPSIILENMKDLKSKNKRNQITSDRPWGPSNNWLSRAVTLWMHSAIVTPIEIFKSIVYCG